MLTQVKQAPNKLSMISNLVSLNLREFLEDICEEYGIQNPPSFFFFLTLPLVLPISNQAAHFFFFLVAHLLMLSKHYT